MKNDESIPTAALPSLRPGISGGTPRDGVSDLFSLRKEASSPGNHAYSPPGSAPSEPAVPGAHLWILGGARFLFCRLY